jgi:hypothetical protein
VITKANANEVLTRMVRNASVQIKSAITLRFETTSDAYAVSTDQAYVSTCASIFIELTQSKDSCEYVRYGR